jgi:SAM-dependent methyltransferase
MGKTPCVVCDGLDSIEVFNRDYGMTGLGLIPLRITVCDKCGAVFQNPMPAVEKIRKTYSEMSNYTNPGRAGLPSPSKIYALDRQLDFVRDIIPKAGSAFQVGCSDGYTLHRFEELGWEVDGIDPSANAIAIAKSHYGLNLNNGFIEEFVPKNDKFYDLIILTHVLEHFVNPAKVIEKCLSMLKDDGFLFIEVPSLVNQETWPTSYFTFEHLTYFSPISMKNLLNKNGVKLISPIKIDFASSDPYPIQMCIGVKADLNKDLIQDLTAHKICDKYVTRDVIRWKTINDKIKTSIESCKSICIWGAGVHTAQLIQETDVLKFCENVIIVDSDKQKWDKDILGFKVASPDVINLEDINLTIVISTFGGEREINKSLVSNINLKAKIITLYS